MRLPWSDNFYDHEKETDLQLTVKVYNINNRRNLEVMKCVGTRKGGTMYGSMQSQYDERHLHGVDRSR